MKPNRLHWVILLKFNAIMGAYHYQAFNHLGQTTKGIIEADSERHARQLLREMTLIPTELKTLTKPKSLPKKNSLSAKNLSLFTRQLATLLKAGIPAEEALKGVSEQTDKAQVREIIIGVRGKVLEGYSLALAMKEFPEAFPELYRATVGAGEQTGRLDMVLEKLADYTENQQEIKQKIQQALLYPAVMILVSVTIITFLLTFVVPKIIEVFSSSGQTLLSMTKMLILLSDFLKSYGVYLVLLLFLLLMAFKRCLNYTKFKMLWHRLLLKLPITTYSIRTVNVARYIHTFGILFAAGVSVLEAMKVATSLINNLCMRQAFDQATLRVREGSGIHLALKETGFIRPMALHLIASGEKSGQIANLMAKAASHLDSEVKRLIETALTLLEPLVVLLMGGMVLFIVLATLLPIFSMEQLIG